MNSDFDNKNRIEHLIEAINNAWKQSWKKKKKLQVALPTGSWDNSNKLVEMGFNFNKEIKSWVDIENNKVIYNQELEHNIVEIEEHSYWPKTKEYSIIIGEISLLHTPKYIIDFIPYVVAGLKTSKFIPGYKIHANWNLNLVGRLELYFEQRIPKDILEILERNFYPEPDNSIPTEENKTIPEDIRDQLERLHKVAEETPDSPPHHDKDLEFFTKEVVIDL